jgi:hypothetical protein
LSIAVVLLIAVWGAPCLVIAVAGGLFRRRLPSTRHLRRVRTDLRG